MLIVGVDPGLSGAIAFLHDGELVNCEDLPTVEVAHGDKTRKEISPALLHDRLINTDIKINHAMVEHVWSSPGMGVTSSFRFGQSFGCIMAVLACAGITTYLVRPAEWKRAFGLNKDKAVSREMAIRLWPDQAHYFARAKDDGRAEASLLAEFSRRQCK
jgi:crossover junction endodeoxyribonuclease RuvC